MARKAKEKKSLKKIILIGIPALLVIASTAFIIVEKPRFATCRVNEEIAKNTRDEMHNAAIAFTQDLLNGKNAEAYAKLSADAKKAVTEAQLAQIQQSIVQFKLQNPKVGDTYYANVIGGKEIAEMTCGNLSEPEHTVAINLKPSAKQGYVLINAQGAGNNSQLVYWLSHNNDEWKVESFIVAPTTILDKSYRDLLSAAREEVKKQHQLNSFLLYVSAHQLTSRGPDFKLGAQKVIEQEMSQVTVPEQFRGEGPHVITDGTSSYNIIGMGPIAVEGKVYLIINHGVEPWASERVIDRSNQKLISIFASTFPEYKEVFAGIIARAYDKKNNVYFGSVEGKPAAVKAAPKPAPQVEEVEEVETESAE